MHFSRKGFIARRIVSRKIAQKKKDINVLLMMKDIGSINIALFSAIFTLSALSGTVLAMLAGLTQREHFGIPILDYISLKKYKFKPESFIILSLVMVAIAIVPLRLKVHYGLVAYLILEIAIICIYTLHIWKVITNSEYCESLLLESFIGNQIRKKEIERFIKCLFAFYYNEVLLLNEYQQNRGKDAKSPDSFHLLRILKTNDKNSVLVPLYNGLIEEYGSKLLELDVIQRIGIDKAYEIMNLGETDSIEVIRKSASKLLTMNERELAVVRIQDRIRDIISSKNLDEKEKYYYLAYIRFYLFENSSISTAAKVRYGKIFLEYIFGKWDKEPSNAQFKACINVYINSVLINGNWDEAESVFDTIISTLNKYSYFGAEDIKIELIAYIYVLTYVYSFLETETINESHRMRIRELLNKEVVNNVDNYTIALSHLILSNYTKVLKKMIGIAEDAYKYGSLEYIPVSIRSKSSIWENNTVYDILYATYFLNVDLYLDPIYKGENWEAKELDEQIIIVKDFISKFNRIDETIQDSFYIKVQTLAQWFKIDDPCTQGSFSIEYSMANEELIALQKNQKPVEGEPLVVSFVPNEYMCRVEKPEEAIVQSKKELLVDYGFNNVKYFDNNSLIRTGYSICREVLNSLIEQFLTLKEVVICRESIREFICFIENESIKYANTSFLNFLGSWGNIRESTEYEELKILAESIKIIRDDNISYYICGGSDMPKYYFEVIEVIRAPLLDDEIVKICEENRIADNKYLFDDGVYGKKDALEYIYNYFRHDKVRIAVSHNFDHITAYRVEFKRKKTSSK